MNRVIVSLSLLGLFLVDGRLQAQTNRRNMPRENVVDVPSVGAGLCVSNVFQSNMVLQRDKPINLWGWAEAQEQITVSFGGNQQATTAGEDRTWKVTLPALEANAEPQQLVVTGASQTLTLENILVGDVWLLGGQSNMEFPLERIENGQLEIVSANFANLRILTVPAANGPDNRSGFERLHEWSGWFGRHFRKGDWDVCSPAVAKELSAIGYVFARRLHMASNVPIGVIDVSRGGTTVETWTPDSVLRDIPSVHVESLLADWDQRVADWDAQADLEQRIKNFRQRIARFEKEGREIPAGEVEPSDLREGPSVDQNRPGNCYASMIHPLAGLSVKGAIFHQGYNNCFNGSPGAAMYRHVFPEMIKAWRTAFNDPEMPFGILSLCTEGPVQTLENYSEMMGNVGPYIREAQYETFLEMYRSGDKQVGFTSTYDLRRRWYHPQLKIPAGERIARWALATQYGFEREIRWKPPMVDSMTAEDGKIILRLDAAASAVDNGGPILGFAIAGEDRKFHPATAVHLVTGKDDRGRETKDTKALVLSSPLVPEPVHYRYAWGRSPLGNLQADRQTDIPFATQRSDDWPLERIPRGIVPDEDPLEADRAQRRKLTEALRALDLERRQFEARRVLEGSE